MTPARRADRGPREPAVRTDARRQLAWPYRTQPDASRRSCSASAICAIRSATWSAASASSATSSCSSSSSRAWCSCARPSSRSEVYTAGEDDLVAGEAKIAVFGKILGQLVDAAARWSRAPRAPPLAAAAVSRRARAAARAGDGRGVHAHARDAADRPRRSRCIRYMHRIAFEVISRSLFAATPAGADRGPRGGAARVRTTCRDVAPADVPHVAARLRSVQPVGQGGAGGRARAREVLDELRMRRSRWRSGGGHPRAAVAALRRRHGSPTTRSSTRS